MTYTIEHHNLDGTGSRATRVYTLLPGPFIRMNGEIETEPFADESLERMRIATENARKEKEGYPREYWPAVTDVPCPLNCAGTIRWAEAGYVPGYRICDKCGRHFLANGTAEQPKLLRVGSRRGGFFFDRLRKGTK